MVCIFTEPDEAEEAARKKAMKDLVQSWMDRLQLISLIVNPYDRRGVPYSNIFFSPHFLPPSLQECSK
jgi:hypothetical protein